MFNDRSRGKEDVYKTIKEATNEREKRRLDEISRYKKRYNIDLENTENYDLIIDTSYLDVQTIAEIIINCERSYRENEEFPKKWQGLNSQEQVR